MDDLTSLKGVGKAADKKLRAAGLDSFAKLAAATPDQLNAAQVAGSPADWSAIIAAAAEKVSPAPQRELTDEELSALVQSWDDARAALKAAGETVVSIQYQIDTAETGSDISLFEGQLAEAKGRVAAAEAAIAALTPLPEGLRLPDAKVAAEVVASAGENAQADVADESAAPAETPKLTTMVVTPAELDLINGLWLVAAERGQTLSELVQAAMAALAAAERDDLVNDIEGDAENEISPALLGKPGQVVLTDDDDGLTIVPFDVTVLALQDSRWRIGRQFTRVPVIIPRDTITIGDLNRLEGDPLLAVSF